MAANGDYMVRAAKQGSWNACFQLISNGAPVDFADESGLTATFYAIKYQEPKVLQLLLQLGASSQLNGINLVSWAVRMAAQEEKKDSLECLQATLAILKDAGAPFGPLDPACVHVVDWCASIRMIQWIYSTVLQVPGAVRMEVDVVADLYERGILHLLPGRLHKAAGHGSLENARVLIECGADVNAEHVLGFPLAIAAEAGHVEIVRELLRHKANPSASTKSNVTPALHAAIKSGKWEIVQLLLAAGAPITTVDDLGRTVLFQAIATDQREMFFKFVEMGADPCIQLQWRNWTLLHAAAQYNRTWCLPFLIVECGLDVNGNSSPLIVAVRSRSYDVVRDLISSYKASITPDGMNETVLHLATDGDYHCLRLMVSLGCDVRVGTGTNPKYTVLHAAAANGNMLCVQWLLHMRYFDVDVRDQFKRTPLHYALRPPRVKHLILWLLNEADADVDAEDCHSVRPLYSAVNFPDVVQLLLEVGATDGLCQDGLTALDRAIDEEPVVETLLCDSVQLSRLS